MNDAHTVNADALVLGAGPAGCSAAIALAELGLDVALVERETFPRAKVCGEFVSPAATEPLETLLTPDELVETGARRVRTLVLERGSRSATFPMNRPAWVLSRRSLDERLVQAAETRGVRVLQPASIRELSFHERRVVAVVETKAAPPARERDHATVDRSERSQTRSRRSQLHAGLVVHADGSGRFSSDRAAVPKRPGVLGIKCHIEHDPSLFDAASEALRMRAPEGPIAPTSDEARPGVPSGGAYLGYVPVERGLATAAFVVRQSIVKSFVARFGPLDGPAGDELLAAIWPRYNPQLRRSPFLSCGVAGSPLLVDPHPRSVRVGNAAAAVEPVGGEGIGLALWAGLAFTASLRSAAGVVNPRAEDVLDERTLRRARAAYHRAYRRRLRLRRPACRAAAWALERPRLTRAIWPLVMRPPAGPALVGAWSRATGKPA